ncbi:glycosyltransferase [Nesterenkonia sphaerica]|nr:glycosyltransferase [Nesterenkonia sphaerica]
MGVSDSGHLRIRKPTEAPRHLTLQATPQDLKRLRQGKGIAVDPGSAYSAWLNAVTTGGAAAQLVIHEFDKLGQRVARWAVDNKKRGVLVTDPHTRSLVLSVRTAGVGSATVKNLEFSPLSGTSDYETGFRLQGAVPAERANSGLPNAQDIGVLMSLRRTLYDRIPLRVVLKEAEAPTVASALIAGGHLLEAQAVVDAFDLYSRLRIGELKKIFYHARRTGYIRFALCSMREVSRRKNDDADRQTVEQLTYECQFHNDPWDLLDNFPRTAFHDPAGPVLHMVGKSYPETQTGYTLRTKYTVDALRRQGIDSVVAVQTAGNHGEGLEKTTRGDVDGTPVVQFGGLPANQTSRKAWLRRNAAELYALVQQVRPSVIHAHSDFINGVLATHVGEAVGIPVVYETRGFWEETWLSRIGQSNEWGDPELISRTYGYPHLYLGRRYIEGRVRERADRNVTLAQTMKDSILEQSPDGAVRADHVYLARNAVDPADFPLQPRSAGFRADLGLAPGDVVLGYISSMVEYEGIEVLISAYRQLRDVTPNVRLLLVGGGRHLEELKRYAAREGLHDVIFTDKVPHEEVIEYYHAIDVFVVPRRRTRVTELVTPLKPFEAFSTGRPVVMSDVEALAEIARDSGGAGRLFPADDSGALANVLSELVHDEELRERLGRQGAEWVRRERSWDANVLAYAKLYRELQAEVLAESARARG